MEQSRKKRNIEIERQKKQKHHMQMGMVVAVVLVIVLALAWVVWDSQSRRWIMTFDGERVAAADLRFMMDTFGMFGDAEDVKDMAMDELMNTLTILNRGERHGVGLTDEERAVLVGEVEMQLQWMNAYYITADRVAELFGTNHVSGRLMDIYVPDYTPDPIEFAQALMEHIEDNAANYESFEAKFVVMDDPIEAARIFMLADEVDDFDDLIREYSIYYDEEWGIQTVDVRELISDFWLDEEESEILMNLQEGELHMIQADEYFLVLYMYDRSGPDFDLIEENFRESYIVGRRFEIYNELLQTWLNEINYTINQRAYAAI